MSHLVLFFLSKSADYPVCGSFFAALSILAPQIRVEFLGSLSSRALPHGSTDLIKSFRINTYKKHAVTTFRMNTCKSLSKQRTLTSLRMIHL